MLAQNFTSASSCLRVTLLSLIDAQSTGREIRMGTRSNIAERVVFLVTGHLEEINA